MLSQQSGTDITNSGAITGQVAVNVDTEFGQRTLIVNEAKGLIDGGTDAVETETAGAIKLINHGTIIGNIDCTVPGANDVIINRGTIFGSIDCAVPGANDVIINHGNIDREIFLNGGNGVFNGKGGTSGEIFCGTGNHKVTAGNGNNVIDVGTGNNTLTAGPGPGIDQFIFDSAIGGHVDLLKHFAGDIVLSKTNFPGIGSLYRPLAVADFHIGTYATTPSQHIIYNPHNGFLFYDPDGNGPLPQIHFATISGNHPDHYNFLVEA
jgi:Ca2+-binding RTX toxin-like protein